MSRRFLHAFLGLTILAALLGAPAASAAPGDLDPSFGSGGSVRLLPSNEDITIRAVAVQPDLKIVLAGAEAPGDTILLRLLPNGQLDPSFGSGGKVTTVVPTGFSVARAVALQPDGRIVVAGGAKGAANFDFFFARYNPDGSPDASFGGGDGIELVPVGAGNDEAEAVTIGPDGRIAATGSADLPMSDEALAAVVLGANGTPDSSFGGEGSVMKSTPQKSDEGVAIAMVGGGGVLLGDSNASGGGKGFVLMKLLPNGEYDPAFGGGDGIVETPIPGAEGTGGRVTDFVLRPDGRIVASGYGYDAPPGDFKFAAVGYLPDGALDTSFAGTGIFSRQIGPGSDAAEVVQLTPAGKILLAGSYDPLPGNASPALLRLDPLGALDPGFGSGGIVARGVQAPFGEIFEDAALDAEERLVTVSTAYVGGGNTEIVVTRYLGDKVPVRPISITFNRAPRALMKKVPRKVVGEKLKGFSGTAQDFDGDGLSRVQVALVKKKAKGKGRKAALPWKKVKGTGKWSFKLKRELPPGRYVVFARAIDGRGLAETEFSRKLRNRYGFRVLPSAR